MTEHKFTPVISALRAAYISEMIHQTEAHDHDRVERFGEQFDRAMRIFARDRFNEGAQSVTASIEILNTTPHGNRIDYRPRLMFGKNPYDDEPAEPAPEYECLNNAGEWRPCPVPTCHRQRRRTDTKTPNP